MSEMNSEIPVASDQVFDPSATPVSVTDLEKTTMTIDEKSHAVGPQADIQSDNAMVDDSAIAKIVDAKTEQVEADAADSDAATDANEAIDVLNDMSEVFTLAAKTILEDTPSKASSTSLEDSASVAMDEDTLLSAAAAAIDINSKPEYDMDIKSDPETEEQPIKLVSYHTDADMLVKTREPAGTVLYNVCSALVAAASPVWSKVIQNQKVYAFFNGKSVVDLTGAGDHSFGLDIVFSIIHYKYHETPGRPDVDQLYSIAHVVETYNCAHLLIPYMEKWVAGLNWHIVMKNEQNDDEKTMYLTWVLGEARWFVRVISKVAHLATVREDGVLVDTCGKPWKDYGLPQVILDMITETRTDCLTKIVQAVNQPLQEIMMDGSERTMRFCRSKTATSDLKEACQLMQLGSLVSGLTTAGLLPFPMPDEYRGSVSELAAKAHAVRVVRYRVPGTPPHMDGHINCGIEHKEALSRMMSEDAQLSSDIIRQLRMRALKSGAYSDELFRELQPPKECDSAAVLMEELHRDGAFFKQVLDVVSPHMASLKDEFDTVIKMEEQGVKFEAFRAWEA